METPFPSVVTTPERSDAGGPGRAGDDGFSPYAWCRLTLLSRFRSGFTLLACRRGATVVEFALVAVPLVSLLLATLETALISFSQQMIETVAETAARTITTGQAQSANMTQQQFHDAACAPMPSYLSCAKLIVDVQKASSFAAVSTSTPVITYDASGKPITAYAIGGAGDIVIVRALYMWPLPNIGFGLKLANAGGTHLLVGVNVAKTEPYTS